VTDRDKGRLVARAQHVAKKTAQRRHHCIF
jgi:hypothetical protein